MRASEPLSSGDVHNFPNQHPPRGTNSPKRSTLQDAPRCAPGLTTPYQCQLPLTNGEISRANCCYDTEPQEEASPPPAAGLGSEWPYFLVEAAVDLKHHWIKRPKAFGSGEPAAVENQGAFSIEGDRAHLLGVSSYQRAGFFHVPQDA